MSPPTPTAELQRERERLLAEACPFVAAGGQPPYAVAADTRAALAALYDPARPAPFCAETARFVDSVLATTPQGRRERLLVETSLLKRAISTAQPQINRAPYGLVEGVFPVVVNHRVVHVLQTGPLKQEPWSETELATLAKVFGGDPAGLARAARALPVHTSTQVERLLELHQASARAVQGLLAASPPSAPVPAASPGRSMDELNFGLAHHLNNLLSVVLGYASSVQNRETNLGDDSRAALKAVCDAAQKARRVTTEWLGFSNHAAEKVSLVRLHDVVLGVLALLEPQNSGRVRFTTQFKAARDTVAALPSAVQRVVFNMLVTAIDSLPAAGGLIGLKTKNVKAEPDDPGGAREFLRIEVADSGGLATLPGVDPLVAELMAMGTRDDEESAGGLYAMVRELDGTIMISSDRDAVTKVEVLLPLCTEEEFKAPARAVRPRQTASRIWIADDDPVFAEMCAGILRNEGHEVRLFADSVSLREQWIRPEGKPDLVVYDHNLPEASGLEIRQWMQAANLPTPLLLVSGMSPTQADISDAIAMRKTHFLQKPFSARELADMASVAMGETLVGA